MAIGGSFSQDAFTPKDPWRTWAEVQGLGLYWDTDNQFAAGKQGVKRFDTPITSSTRSGVRGVSTSMSPGRQPRYNLGVNAPVGRLESPTPPVVNMFGAPTPISSGSRNYGEQSIDRGELARLSSAGTTVANVVSPIASRVGEGWAGVRARRRDAREAEQQAREAEQTGREMMAAGIPPAPGSQEPSPLPSPAPGSGRPGGLPAPEAPPAPQKSPLATSNWREVQAQRIAEQSMGQPGQPAPDVTLGSRMYQEEIARRRAQRTPGAPMGFPPPPGSTAPSPLAPPPPDAKRPPTLGFPAPELPTPPRPGSVGTTKVFPRGPVSMVGDQNARLAAEGAAPAQPAPKKGKK